MSAARYPSPTRKDTAITYKKQLSAYNITVRQGIELPEVLAKFVSTLQQSRQQGASPHAQAILDTRRAAALENETTARKMLDENILFRGEAHPDGIKGLTLKDQVDLVGDFPLLGRRVLQCQSDGAYSRSLNLTVASGIVQPQRRQHAPASNDHAVHNVKRTM
ncbi:hypothetical protein UVI_02061960 [Ustilaginoidea virens]|uniref:Uncharacterized protein n=1 Tax=Ustilaginoidea virens TaxID=1159556 RepID=A0A063C585_USTVR|nr:hypothetical protein UVI_02061960 [Ustilaginoidea virens]